jgi:hypothetical protein
MGIRGISVYLEGTNIINTRKNYFYSRTLLPNNNGCIEWAANLKSNGYAQFRIGNKMVHAHRYSYELHIGKIPCNMMVLHKCDNRKCVSPNHLFLGTQKDNVIDMLTKNRANTARGEASAASKLTENDVINIRKRLSLNELPTKLAKEFNVKVGCIWKIKYRQTWRELHE